MKNKAALIIFTKNPVLGNVKTRLAKSVGDEKALEIYNFLLQKTINVTAKLDAQKTVYYGDYLNEDDGWDVKIYSKKIQQGTDLGERMHHAFEQTLKNSEKAVIIGCDCFELTEEIIHEAFLNLEFHDAVIGPANDGGYYLLGLKVPMPGLFSNKNWGTNTVLKETLHNLKNQKVHLLEPLNDVDTLEDIQQHPAFQHLLNTQYER